MLGALRDFVLPPVCVRCGTPWEGFVCSSCGAELRAAMKLHERDLGMFRARAPFVYAEVKPLIVHLKYHGVRALAESLAGFLAVVLDRDAVLVPVPLHPKRKRERGFSQTELLAGALARRGFRVVRALARVKYTRPQVELTGADRRENVEEAFRALCRPRGKLWLLDDVITTGSTVMAAARALGGVCGAVAVAFAREGEDAL